MNYEEAVRYIESLLVFGSRPGLERIRELIERIGSPDRRLKFIHVAGTNGKGSVCAMLSSVLREQRYRTGLFISPYVLEFRERFQINGEMIPHETLAQIVEQLIPVVQAMKDEGKIITEFEFVLAVALTWYAQEQCDIVVLETGMGGRFDATNIITTPLASVIMSISLDHTAILGDTCEKIAFEKCGIIKSDGHTVVYGDQPEGVLEVVRAAASERRNTLTIASPDCVEKRHTDLHGSDFTFRDPDTSITQEYHIPFLGDYQLNNAAAALFTLRTLRQNGLVISEEAIRSGLSKAFFPARSELLGEAPVILLDGAHNPGGTKAFSAVVKEHLAHYHKVAVCGMLADKDVRQALRYLIPLFDSVMTVSPQNPRAMSSEELASIVSEYHVPTEAFQDYSAAYEKALQEARKLTAETGKPSAIVVFGSLYLASDMRKVILTAKG